MVDLQRCTLSLYEIKDEEDIKYKLELRVFVSENVYFD